MQISTVTASLLYGSMFVALPVVADGLPVAPVAQVSSAPVAIAEPAAPAAAASSSAPTAADAASWYERAEAEWRQGDSSAARESMRRSYELSGRPELLFNLGQLSRELGECEAALRYYREYLGRIGSGGREHDARRAVAELEGRCAPAAAKPPPGPPPSAPEPAYWTAPRVVGWSAVGVGAAAAAGAAYFALSAADAERDLESLQSSTSRDGSGAVAWDGGANEREAEGERAETWGRVFAAAAVTFVAGGAFLVIANPGSERSEAAPVSVGWTGRELRAEYTLEF